MFRNHYKEANDEIEVNDQLIDSILKKANEKPKKKYMMIPIPKQEEGIPRFILKVENGTLLCWMNLK